MKKILFITDTYYPDSRATISITRKLLENLCRLGYNVSVYPAQISGEYFEYPNEFNGVHIIKPIVEPRRNICFEYTRSVVSSIEQVLEKGKYDYIFSVSVAFEINLLTHLALNGKKYNWYPMSYDPYAYDPHITESQKQQYIKLEQDALKDAKKIFFLEEFKDDYKGSPFEDKIVYFNLPCIRKIEHSSADKIIDFDKSYINCVFLGDFYYGVENTDFIFRLFEKLDKSIRLYTIGNPGDYQDTIDLWKNKLKDKYLYHSRISQEEAQNIMLDCDVLVSMGHDSKNMCPSKVIDYISTGKPILHIQKIKDCCAKKYLENYSNKYCIYQNDELNDNVINEINNFIISSKDKENVEFEEINKLYKDFTMEELIKKILSVLSKD